MEKKKSQLNIQIDPNLLIALKAEAIKSGKTLTAFVTERLKQSPAEVREDILEQRLLRIEKQLDSLNDVTRKMQEMINLQKSIFSDSGAKKYGEVAREMFELHRKKKKLSFEDAFKEISECLANYKGQPGLVHGIFVGEHILTGSEMTEAYRNGFCGMRSALNDWTESTLEPLNQAFLNAVTVENLETQI